MLTKHKWTGSPPLLLLFWVHEHKAAMGMRELRCHHFLNAPVYTVFHVYTSTLKTEFLKIFTLEGVFKKVHFQWPKTQFPCGQKAKTNWSSYVCVYVWTGSEWNLNWICGRSTVTRWNLNQILQILLDCLKVAVAFWIRSCRVIRCCRGLSASIAYIFGWGGWGRNE